MNVLMYCLSSISGGAVTYLRNLSPLLVERFEESSAHELKFLAHKDQAPLFEGIETSKVSWVSGTRLTGYLRILWERRNLAKIVREQECDVLFTPYQIAPHIPEIRNVLMIRNMEPFLFDRYNYSFRNLLRNRLLRRASTGCLGWADRVIAVSDFAREQLTRGNWIDATRILTVYHGKSDLRSDVDAVKDQEMLRQIGVKDAFFLTCGSLLPYRRCEDVISAFNRHEQTLSSSVQLIIAGSGSDRRYEATIQKAIASSPVREKILTPGHVPKDTMAALYRRSIACVLATEIEACPNIAIEAMAAGCVIISTDQPPLPEMFCGCSLEYRARDIGHLARQMRIAIANGTRCHELKAAALKRAGAFSWKKCAGETYSALVNW